jgi:hypothetical protein
MPPEVWREEGRGWAKKSLTYAIPIGATDRDGGPTILDPAVNVTAPLKRSGTLTREAEAVETQDRQRLPIGLWVGTEG